jgi:integrase
MAINEYMKQLKSGKLIKRYKVNVEAVNEYTGRRVQKQESDITSKPKAERRERELWLICKKGHPVLPEVRNWEALKKHYLKSLEDNIRSDSNPAGIGKKTYWNKKSSLNKLTEIQGQKYQEQGLINWKDLDLRLITPQFLTDELNCLVSSEKVSGHTAAKIQKEVKATFGYAVEVGFLKVNPLEGMKKRKVPKKRKVALNHEEANKLLLEAKRQDHPYYLVWLLSMFLGCRRSELAGLKWTDIDFESRLVFIERQMIPGEGLVPYPKDKEPRPTPLHIGLIPLLKEYKLKAQSEFVIELEDSDWKWGNQAKVIKDFCTEIGIKEITHHQLRNTFIMLSLADDVGLAYVKESVGHTKLSTTDEYYTASGLHLKGKTDKLSIKIPVHTSGDVIELSQGEGVLKENLEEVCG